MSQNIGYQPLPTTPVSGQKRKYSDSTSDNSNNDNFYDPANASWNSSGDRRWENRSSSFNQSNRKNGGNWKRTGGAGYQRFFFYL